MRIDEAKAKKGPGGVLMAAVMGLVLVAGFFLTLVAPTELDQNFTDVGEPEAAGIVSASPDGIPPAEMIAANRIVDDSSSLDLQLD